ncbi:DUF6084 family protein [Pararobbsia alpina]|uniref:Uncharacterized protein n=1 Tax=Pararobbsia alpina TaxID=621374 RepID=A0A6S7C1H5_9BURK|nr:DUF6084 family protein [Pararobbsia alpina]CAB3799189.1 hypothetical protein LMG28138_04606 [Pararobbsia alpina]
MPELDFVVEGAEVALHSVSPLLLFKLRLTNTQAAARAPEEIASLALQCQIQIEATRRSYQPADQARLAELFGVPSRWGQTVRTLLWTHANAAVPPFSDTCSIDLPVPCTFDFNVAAAKYFDALEDGEIPLMLQFSGTIFYRESDGRLQVARVPWHKEAAFRLPVATWRAMRDYYYPNGAWLCVQRDVFERMERYRIEHGLTGWDDSLMALLDRAGTAHAIPVSREAS